MSIQPANPRHFDAVIIGGGMVGKTMACALAPHMRIALVDAAPLTAPDDHRLIALNYSSYCLFKNLGLWDALAANATPIHAVHVSQRGHLGMTRLQHDELNLPVIGFVVPAKFIEEALTNTLKNFTDLTLLRPATLKNLTRHADHVSLLLHDESVLTANFIIGADGTYSSVRELAGIASEVTAYQQTALVTVTTLQRTHRHIAYERFHTKGGAIAMLPLGENHAATIWSADNAVIDKLMQLDDNAFLQTLQTDFGYRLGRFLKTGPRYTYPLQMQKAAQDHIDKVILIGNAAHTLHPVAAQGLNLALAEIAMLTQIILASPQHPAWHDYLAWQQKQMAASIHLSHHLLHLFAVDALPVRKARSAAMLALDLCAPLKRRFALKALGRSLHLPALLRDAALD
jgi:2-octaprenyl-6-methoxyphenol hydroxylase